jgi:hypothetical protein
MRRFLLLLFVINTAFVLSQTETGTLKVIVTDENGEDILGANISVYQNNAFVKGNFSDPFGLATIAFLEPGVYTLKTSFVGYATVSQEFSIASNNVTTLNIKMQVQTEELNEIVLVEKKPLISEPYGGMTTKASKVPTRGTTGVTAVAGGVTSKDGKAPVIRGGRANQTITYIDGMPVRGSGAMAQSSYGEIQTQFSGTPAKFENATSPSGITGLEPIEKVESATLQVTVIDHNIEELKEEVAEEITEEVIEEIEEEYEEPEVEFEKILTAGELNDFNKFDQWTEISNDYFDIYEKEWNLKLTGRYAVIVRNKKNTPVLNAKVNLLDRKGNKIWSGMTNNAGRVELWSNFETEIENNKPSQIEIIYDGQSFKIKDIVEFREGINSIRIPVNCFVSKAVDIAFVVDNTASMTDEIDYLKQEINHIIKTAEGFDQNVKLRTSSIFYMDYGQRYTTDASPLTNNLDNTSRFIKSQTGGNGGDIEEAVDTALSQAITSLDWNMQARSRIVFLVLDASPHKDSETVNRFRETIKLAAKKGIRVVPVICSSYDKSNEYLMRNVALATNGTYVFLTDHSGIGNAHMAPTTDEYEVTYLNDLLIDIIKRFTTVTTCNGEEIALVNSASPKIIAHEKTDTIQIAVEKIVTPENELLNQVFPVEKDEVEMKVIKTSGSISKAEPIDEYDFDEIRETNKLSLYPNPCNTLINLKFSAAPQQVMLLDGAGQLLRMFDNPHQDFSIELNEFAAGYYFVGYVNDYGELKTERFIISR